MFQLACMQQTHCGLHASIFLHTQMTTRAGSLFLAPMIILDFHQNIGLHTGTRVNVFVQVESSRNRASEYIIDLWIISSSFEMATSVRGLTDVIASYSYVCPIIITFPIYISIVGILFKSKFIIYLYVPNED